MKPPALLCKSVGKFEAGCQRAELQALNSLNAGTCKERGVGDRSDWTGSAEILFFLASILCHCERQDVGPVV